jgi:predicted phosphodiesterase
MIALISDIHGNYEALKSVLSVIDAMGIKKTYCLGDIVGYYPQVNECCDELRKRNIPCLLGNHDWYLVSGEPCTRSKSANDCIKYHREIITSINLHWVTSFPLVMEERELSLVHGGWNNPIDEYFTPTLEYFDPIVGSFFSSGHSHKPAIKQFGEKVYCNPGSVGQPRDGDRRASFATFDGSIFKLVRVGYNIEKVCLLMEQAGFGSYYYSRLKKGAPNFTA